MINVALIEDHRLLRSGLASIVNSFDGYRVMFEADNGRELVEKMDRNNIPDITVMDITMPEMNGFETAAWLHANYPEIKIMALTMLDDERSIIKMLRSGAKAYLLKDSHPTELKNALDSLVQKGIYLNKLLYENIVHSIGRPDLDEETERGRALDLSDREREFLRWLCTDKSYKEIAASMELSPRTVDSYRDALFDKLKVTTRVGLVLFAVRNNVVSL